MIDTLIMEKVSRIAKTVYTEEEVELQDGTVLTLKPCPVKTLRVFMKIMDAFKDVDSEEAGLEVLSDAAAVCVYKQRPNYFDKNAGEHGKGTEDWEDVADMQTIYKILDVCGGVRLNDPNLLAAAEAALGTTST